MSIQDEIPRPEFGGIFIPAAILAIEELSMLDQMLLAWIGALHSKEKGGCFAKNEYLAKKLGVKENTIVKSLVKLRDLCLIVDVSFNGRCRVIRSQVHKYVEYCQSQAGCDLNHMQGWIKITGRVGFLSQAESSVPKENSETHTYHESKEEIKEEKNTPPTPASGDAASPRKGVEFSPEVKEVGAKMVSLLQQANPVYRPPQDINVLLKHVALLLERDKQEAADILDVFQWAVNDNEERGDFKGWQSVLSGKNPIEKFRKHFATLHAQMRSRPKRKFAPSSDDKKAYEALMSMDTII